jgi:hypothetical protein
MTPVELAIPLWCSEMDPPYERPQYLPVQLRRLAQRLPDEGTRYTGGAPRAFIGETVVLATVIDYIATAYGREQVAALWHAFPAHRNWDTLIPAVFGVPVEEFEAGWHAHLTNEYGVGLP